MTAIADRVASNTRPSAARVIARRTEDSIRFHAANPRHIARRLAELDREWDVERALETNAATLVLAGSTLGLLGDRRWLAVPAVVGAFLLQHAVQGWCPPLPVLRRLGFRTVREIDVERTALKALRGDFGPIGPAAGEADDRGAHALQAARL